ncbi:GNAT family N-acetyltransferase [Ruminococcus gauvreauii]|uniref:GNAT family N-acetyltransferase n=1 Tax=Ruminococcus gauvreauii TaxID=438033 RepID=A0ABY5VJH7_9FIRM|nr:GNAT family protein [Ruminococcus gauvreauii]UWP60760.1 GNAT family N-acetyltransferase [Ruminococcus gauvreauii]
MNFELRKWKLEYIADVARYADNEKIAANLRNVFPYPYTRQDAENYVRSCAENTEERQLCRAIVAEGHTIGSIGIFCGSDVYEKSAELGYWLAEDFWGKGIMTEAVRRICREAFAAFDIVRIYAEPFAHNAGSRGVLEKAGFTLEGIMRKGVFKNGELCDYCMYSLLKGEC